VQPIDLEDLDRQLRKGNIPSAWLAGLRGADPSTLLIILWAGRLSRRVEAFYQEALRPYGVQYSDYAVLSLLNFSGALSPKRLNAYLAITSGGLTKAIDRLVKRKLARRAPDPEDGRARLISLTKKGEKLVGELLAQDLQAHEALLTDLSKKDRSRIARSLRELLDVFEAPSE